MPVKVRAVAVPPWVMPLPEAPSSVPSATARVTVSRLLSASPKGVPVKTSGLVRSSVTRKVPGTATMGALSAGLMVSSTERVSVSTPPAPA